MSFLKPRYPQAQFSEAPDWVAANGLKHPACLFVTGEGHARTAYAAVPITPLAGGDEGAVMIHGYGPWPAAEPDFASWASFSARCKSNPESK